MSWSFGRRPWLFGAATLLVSGVSAAATFRDCPSCPRMVVITGGTFTMGSFENEPERTKSEGPRPDVQVATFAIGQTEVTRRQYATFVKETRRPANGCFTYGFGNPNLANVSDVGPELMDRQASWRNPGFKQTDEHPVTCISWQDAKDYAAWLARKTGKPYRLPSEPEWEYAVRAGTTTSFFWGSNENDACRYANAGDPTLLRINPYIRGQTEAGLHRGEINLRFVQCSDGSPYTTAVGRHRPNAFGLYDMIGNVWEYGDGCRRPSLLESGPEQKGVPCEFRPARGGSWNDSPRELRSARRSAVRPNIPRNDGGFRLARDLSAAEIADALEHQPK